MPSVPGMQGVKTIGLVRSSHHVQDLKKLGAGEASRAFYFIKQNALVG